MTHQGTQTIQTARLTLRRCTMEDDRAMLQNWAGDPEVTKFLTWPTHTGLEVTRKVLALWQEAYHSDHTYLWMLVPDALGQPIGTISAVKTDDALQMVEIGYCIGKAWWRQGYVSEALSAVIAFFFEKVGVNRVQARHDPRNPHSGDVMLKCGMYYEGTRRQADLNNQGLSDVSEYAILREDYDTSREIAYYRGLPCRFEDFIQFPALTNGEIYLVCTAKNPAVPEKDYVPSYEFCICRGGESVGGCSLRVGYDGFGPDHSSLYYGGNIGYHVDAAWRGRGYAGEACKLLRQVARAHGMERLLICNNVENAASRRVCEKLGLRHVRRARLPEWIEMYKAGARYANIYEMTLD